MEDTRGTRETACSQDGGGLTLSRLVLGLGSGRCGTVSLSRLLNAQPGFSITHEMSQEYHLPWKQDFDMADRALRVILDRGAIITGDVGFYWLTYVEWILEGHPDAKFLCLRRDPADTVASYLRKTEGSDLWRVPPPSHQPTKSERIWFDCYPSMSASGHTKEKAVRMYVDVYYLLANAFAKEYPESFRVVEMESVLGQQKAQIDNLEWLGVSPERQVINTNIHMNQST